MGRKKKVLLGVTGGIAAYKMPDLIRSLKKRGVDVRVATTQSAERFVTPLTLETVSENRVWTFDWKGHETPVEHLTESLDYDLAIIAPATANFIGKMAGGIADDLLSTLSLALACPVYVAPAMNPRMFSNQAVADNIETLKKRGVRIISPDEGDTACGETGVGRLASLENILSEIENALGLENDLEGLNIVVTAGRTEEPIDSVRFISNRSSGKMGISIASSAQNRGANVTLIHGPVSEQLPETTDNRAVRTAEELYRATEEAFDKCDVLIMTAAVSDFRPAHSYDGKIKKKDAQKTVHLLENPDILKSLGGRKKGQILIGFAAETENWIENGREKMISKNADLVCLNDVSRSDIGFESDYNEVIFLSRSGTAENSGRLSKRAIAEILLDKVSELAKSKVRASAEGNR